jgi:integrase/recombinase XerD
MSAQPARSGLRLVDERPPGPGLTDFALWLRANGCGENTITERLSHLADFTRSHPSFPNVKPMYITAWLGREGLAPWTRATYYGHLRSYFTFALENDLLTVDPMARMRRPKVPQGAPRPLTPAQVDQVMDSATNANLHAWLTLGLFAGLRAHEIAKIRTGDVDQLNIRVVGKGAVGADIPTHPRIWTLAMDHPGAGWWFPSRAAAGHVTSLSVSTLVSRHFKANGIEGSIHRCRHTYATELLRAGVNIRVVQELMRHKSLSSTQIYTAVDEDERVDAISRLGAGPPSNLDEGPEVVALRAALAVALATRHPTATATEDGREDMARYLATLAKEARDAAAGESS